MGNVWANFVKQFYETKKKSNPSYKFSQALKDASKVYKARKA